MSFVVDASAAVALHFADEYAPFAGMEEALENGAEALLTKPIDFGTLRSEIDTRVERAA